MKSTNIHVHHKVNYISFCQNTSTVVLNIQETVKMKPKFTDNHVTRIFVTYSSLEMDAYNHILSKLTSLRIRQVILDALKRPVVRFILAISTIVHFMPYWMSWKLSIGIAIFIYNVASLYVKLLRYVMRGPQRRSSNHEDEMEEATDQKGHIWIPVLYPGSRIHFRIPNNQFFDEVDYVPLTEDQMLAIIRRRLGNT